jgi:hypothetical protein
LGQGSVLWLEDCSGEQPVKTKTHKITNLGQPQRNSMHNKGRKINEALFLRRCPLTQGAGHVDGCIRRSA